MRLPDLSILRLEFRLRAEDSVVLPPFLGSTLRGALGRPLKQVFCFVPHGECKRCWFRLACPYQLIFESINFGDIPKEELHPQLRGQEFFPHPFILIPPDCVPKRSQAGSSKGVRTKNINEDYRTNHFATGEHLDFSIILVGKAVRHWAHVIVAVRLMAQTGLGEEESRVPFTLVEAFAHDAAGKSLRVFSQDDPQVSAFGVSPVKLEQIVEMRRSAAEEKNDDSLGIRFLSPTAQRILLDGKATGQLSFASLIKKITERLEHFANLYAEPSQRIDYRPILTDAESVRSTSASLQLYRFEQHSIRKDDHIPRDVFLGEMSYESENTAMYLPFLLAGEILHVGAGTGAGLGKFVIRNFI